MVVSISWQGWGTNIMGRYWFAGLILTVVTTQDGFAQPGGVNQTGWIWDAHCPAQEVLIGSRTGQIQWVQVVWPWAVYCVPSTIDPAGGTGFGSAHMTQYIWWSNWQPIPIYGFPPIWMVPPNPQSAKTLDDEIEGRFHHALLASPWDVGLDIPSTNSWPPNVLKIVAIVYFDAHLDQIQGNGSTVVVTPRIAYSELRACHSQFFFREIESIIK